MLYDTCEKWDVLINLHVGSYKERCHLLHETVLYITNTDNL